MTIHSKPASLNSTMQSQNNMAEDNQLAVREISFENMEKLAVSAAASGMFGITKKEQALCLFAICQAEGMHPIMALRRYHLIDGKPSMRADAMQGEFMAKGGGIIWHVRTDDAVAATLFADKTKIDDAARTRAVQRFDLLWQLESAEDNEVSELMVKISKLSREGEETILRTYEDAEQKGLTWSWKKKDNSAQYEKVDKTNWKQSPRQMLTARVITEGVRLIAPGLIAGIYTPDEVEDIIHAETRDKEEFVQSVLTRGPHKEDRESIQRMIDQYIEDAKTSTGARKSELLGLAAELRVKLQDMDLESDEIPGLEKPAQAREIAAETLPPAAEGELPFSDPRKEIPWQDYVLQHVKQKSLRGKKLGEFTKGEIKVIYEKTAHATKSDDDNIRIEAIYIEKAYQSHYPETENETRD